MTVQDTKMRVSSVIQKSIFEVNEEGSEAAAATFADVQLYSALSFDSSNFYCDHPFMFYIKDNLTGLTLFTGRVVNPASS